MEKMGWRLLLVSAAVLVFLAGWPLHAAASAEAEPNGGIASATAIALNEPATGSIGDGSDVDWYKFTLATAGKVTLNLKHSTLGDSEQYWNITCYAFNANTGETAELTSFLVRGTQLSIDSSALGLPAGTYYVQIAPCDSSWSTSYSLTASFTASSTWERESNNTLPTANAIALNRSYSGAIATQGDEDWYKFTLTTAGKVTLTFKHSTLGESPQYWAVTCYTFNANTGETSELTSSLVRGTQLSLDSSALGLPAGTYYAQIAPCDSSWSTPYSLTASFTASSTWERESNNTLPTANAIALNRSYSGSLAAQGDKDWYKFTLTTAGKVTLAFKHSTAGEDAQYWRVECYAYNANTGSQSTLASFLARGSELGVSSNALGLPAGTYYVQIAPYESTWSTSYSLTASFTASSTWEREFNNTLPTANAIFNQSAYNGALATKTDSDWYKFVLVASDKVRMKFKHAALDSSDIYWKAILYKYDATTGVKTAVTTLLSHGGETSVTSDAAFLSAGTYYVSITYFYYSPLPYSLTILPDKAINGRPSLAAASAGYNKVKLTWKAAAGAKGYQIYRATSSGGTYSLVKTVRSGTTTSYTDSGLSTGRTYYYKMRIYGTLGSKTVYSSKSTVVAAKPVPAKPTGVKAKAASSTSIKVSWGAVPGATGYRVYRATSRAGTYKLVKDTTALSYTNKSLTHNRTYYYKVKAYRKAGTAKVYGGASSVVYARP